MRNTILSFILFFCLFAQQACSFQKNEDFLTAEVCDGGSIDIKYHGFPVALIEPAIRLSQSEEIKYFDAAGSKAQKAIVGVFHLTKKNTIGLKSRVIKRNEGLEFYYEITPSNVLKIKDVDIFVKLFYDDWVGGTYQVGLWPGTITPKPIPYFKSPQQCFAFASQPPGPNALSLEIDGENSLAPVVKDNRPEGGKTLELWLSSEKSGGPIEWARNQKKVFNFKIIFNKEVAVEKGVFNQGHFSRVKSKMLNQPSRIVSTTAGPVGEKEVQPAKDVDSNYPIPLDARTDDVHSDSSLGYHMFVPAKIEIGNREYSGSLFLDSGVQTSGVDINISEEFWEKLGYKGAPAKKFNGSIINSENGGETSKEVFFHLLSNDARSDVGPVETKLELGSMQIRNLTFYTNDLLDHNDLLKCFYQKNDDYFKNNELVGIFTSSMFKKYLISVDCQKEKIYFRPLDARQRTFFDHKPLGQIECRFMTYGIYVPIKINNKFIGYGVFDTGSSCTLLDAERIGIKNFPLKNFEIGGFDVLGENPNYVPVIFKKLSNTQESNPDNVDKVSLIGTDIVKNHFFTIDPGAGKIYIEK